MAEQQTTPPPSSSNSRRGLVTRKRLLVLLVLGGLAGGGYYFFGGTGEQQFAATFSARRGPLEIVVTEGGSVEAQEKVEIKSAVEGETKILSIIDEGYLITAEDVANKKVLVELDSTNLSERLTQQELEYQNAYAAFARAREDFAIQLNQNESDILAGTLAAKFARMDFEKYMGGDVAIEILKEVDRYLEESEQEVVLPTSAPEGPAAVSSEEESGAEKAIAADAQAGIVIETKDNNAAAAQKLEILSASIGATIENWPRIDFSRYADVDRLGPGEAGQRLRKIESDLVVNQKELVLSESQLEGTERLFKREFVTKNDLENDEMKVRRNAIAVEQSGIEKDLFLRYEFPKMAEKLLSDYGEAQRKLQRTRQSAVSKLAQSEAQLKSAEANFELRSRQRRKLIEQIENCTIRAEKPGLVVYGGSGDRWWDNNRVEEGASIRERQIIITLPDTARMAVEVKVHEAYVKFVRKGLKARIRIDAQREQLLTGEVVKVGVLPDSQNRWMSPDLKVYATTVNIEGNDDTLKPGMSAQVEIIVDTLPDVLYVPLQAIFSEGNERVCYVSTLAGTSRRVVETGQFNDSFIEIKSGIDEGDTVLLREPERNKKPGEREESGGGAGKTEVSQPERKREAAASEVSAA